jgi:diphthamide synthase (EF-2-diphthine--ammonia ligase)
MNKGQNPCCFSYLGRLVSIAPELGSRSVDPVWQVSIERYFSREISLDLSAIAIARQDTWCRSMSRGMNTSKPI